MFTSQKEIPYCVARWRPVMRTHRADTGGEGRRLDPGLGDRDILHGRVLAFLVATLIRYCEA